MTTSDPIVVTGSSGLIGSALTRRLRSRGDAVIGIDVRPADTTDIVVDLLDPDSLSLIEGDVGGVVHLAAVSRVVWGQNDPVRCWETNVTLTRRLLAHFESAQTPPWFVYASSREVYGQPRTLPCPDDTPVAPINIYARSKAAAEALVLAPQAHRRNSNAVVRFSSVFGGLEDHADRVVPAFFSNAIHNRPLTVNGSGVCLDLTHLDDVIDGLFLLMDRLNSGAIPSRPILFSTGVATSLVDLAARVVECTNSRSEVVMAPPRTYDVERFSGQATYAREFLGWQPARSLDENLARYTDLLMPATPIQH